MLTRIQIKAKGISALKVETELREAIAKIVENCGLQGGITQQVIEGTPGASFEGRLLFKVGSVRQPWAEKPKVRTGVRSLDAVARQNETAAVGKVSVTGGEAA